MKILIILSGAVLLAVSGCCSIFTSGPQSISVDSEPPGAKVVIGEFQGTTPYRVEMPRGRSYVIEATLNGQTRTKALTKSIEPVYWVNILFWPGLIIDLATGKMFKYEPKRYNFDFSS